MFALGGFGTEGAYAITGTGEVEKTRHEYSGNASHVSRDGIVKGDGIGWRVSGQRRGLFLYVAEEPRLRYSVRIIHRFYFRELREYNDRAFQLVYQKVDVPPGGLMEVVLGACSEVNARSKLQRKNEDLY